MRVMSFLTDVQLHLLDFTLVFVSLFVCAGVRSRRSWRIVVGQSKGAGTTSLLRILALEFKQVFFTYSLFAIRNLRDSIVDCSQTPVGLAGIASIRRGDLPLEQFGDSAGEYLIVLPCCFSSRLSAWVAFWTKSAAVSCFPAFLATLDHALGYLFYLLSRKLYQRDISSDSRASWRKLLVNNTRQPSFGASCSLTVAPGLLAPLVRLFPSYLSLDLHLVITFSTAEACFNLICLVFSPYPSGVCVFSIDSTLYPQGIQWSCVCGCQAFRWDFGFVLDQPAWWLFVCTTSAIVKVF